MAKEVYENDRYAERRLCDGRRGVVHHIFAFPMYGVRGHVHAFGRPTIGPKERIAKAADTLYRVKLFKLFTIICTANALPHYGLIRIYCICI